MIDTHSYVLQISKENIYLFNSCRSKLPNIFNAFPSQYTVIIRQPFIKDFWHKASLIFLLEKCSKKRCPGDGFVGKDCKCWCKGPSAEQPAIYCDSKKPVSGGNSIGPKPTKPVVTEDKDRLANCPTLARLGQCKDKKSASYMQKVCKKSCKAVTGGKAVVGTRDNNRNCPKWARLGECKRNPGYMLRNCKKSCKRI